VVRFLVVRLGLIVLTLFVISIAIFAITEILPGDVAQAILGQGATASGLEALRHRLGLDQPVYLRYLHWVGGVLHGDLGTSLSRSVPVASLISGRLFNSVVLASFAFLITVPTAIAIGVWAGVREGSLFDRVASMSGLMGISLPEFVTGVLLIMIFSSRLGWLPSSSLLPPGKNPLSDPTVLVLPGLTLTAVLFGYIMRMTRANVIEVMHTNYVRTAILKGLPMRRVIWQHVLRNAMLPTISVVTINIGYMLGGLIIVETVFSYPGLGSLLLDAITKRDVPLLQALALLIAGVYALSNLAGDLLYAALNPRIRYA
jgi:peptide/nickel transport system permease protein